MADDNIHCYVWTKDGCQGLTLDEYLKFDESRLHRLDGPADVCKDSQAWWVNGKLTRIDGPAVMDTDGSIEWWLDDKPLPNDKIEAWLKENNIDLSTKGGQIAFKIMWS